MKFLKRSTERDKKKITKKLWIDEFLYGRNNQAALGLPCQYDDEEVKTITKEEALKIINDTREIAFIIADEWDNNEE